MAGGGIATAGDVRHYNAKTTTFVIVACQVAATGGLIFGYDIGISGGVTSMDVFLKEFFPSVYKAQLKSVDQNQYCKFDSQLLTAFTSSLYVAGLIATYFASATTRALGRKVSMLIGGAAFLIGSVLNGCAVNIEMLILGRIFLGIGVGFANQAVPLYISEMAPPQLRGALNNGFQMATTIGILVANMVNYGTAKIKKGYGWRISLALAAVPAIIMTIGALVLPDTPNSLIERGHHDRARAMLQRIRGTTDIHEELEDLIEASQVAAQMKDPWKNIMHPKYRPELMTAIFIPAFQQLTGINVIMFYAPVLFKTLGFGDNASLMSAAITGGVNVVATSFSIATVDLFGRRFLFLEGGVQMLICQVSIGIILGKAFGTTGTGHISEGTAHFLLVLICFYVAAFAWSWGPLGWLVPSEVFPLEIRSAAQSITVAVNFLFTFIIAQLFLFALCHLKFALFFLFAAFVMAMSVYVFFFVPETKGVPLEEMNRVWANHWYWKKYVAEHQEV